MTEPFNPGVAPLKPQPPYDPADTKYDPAAAKAAADKTAADKAAADKITFETSQKAAAEKFERDQKAAATKRERQLEADAAKSKTMEEIAKATKENDDKAYDDGLLTHEDLLTRQSLLATHHGCLLPHAALLEGEGTVKMAFPRTVVLTRSAVLAPDNVVLTRGRGLHDDSDEIMRRPIAHGSRVLFLKGYQDVPVSLADHQYLADNGAYRVGADGKPEPAEARAERVKKADADRLAAAKA